MRENAGMKVLRVLCLCLAIVVPQIALAELPLSNKTLEQVEGILDFCSQVNPQLAKYNEKSRTLVGKASPKDLADARKSDEYKDAYDAISAELAKVPKERAVDTCTGFLEGHK